jgi:hypothetical protein
MSGACTKISANGTGSGTHPVRVVRLDRSPVALEAGDRLPLRVCPPVLESRVEARPEERDERQGRLRVGHEHVGGV